MAAPTFHAAGALAAVATGSSVTAVIPAGTQADDVAVVAYMCNASSTFSTPSGWTLLGTTLTSTNQSTAWFWKRLAGGDANPQTTTGATLSSTIGGYGRVYVFRGCVTTGDPFEGVSHAGAPTLSAFPQIPAITTTGTDRLAVSIIYVDDDNTWSSGMPPTNWTNIGGRAFSTTGGDCMSDALSRVIPTATTVPGFDFGGMSASDYWRTLGLAFIPAAGLAVTGTATGAFGFTGVSLGELVPPIVASGSRAPIPAILMVNTPGDWNVHPYYPVPITPTAWGNADDLALIDTALSTNYPNRTRTVLIAEDDGTANGRCVTAMNWALRHYDEVQAIALRAPIIDLQERHTRLGGAEATSIESAYGGSGTYLNLTGAAGGNATTTDKASLDITGDLDGRIELKPDAWTAPFWKAMVGKWVESGDQRSWKLQFDSTGKMEFHWSTSGTGEATGSPVVSTVSPETVHGDAIGAIGWTIDVVNGANKTITFYTAASMTASWPWTTLGSVSTTAGNTSIFSGTAPLEIGTTNNGAGAAFVDPFKGAVRKFELRNGINGTVVANPDFTARTPGATSFSDTASTANTWTINSPASIVAGFLAAMPIWNPGYTHRRDMAAQLFADKLHIWRDPSDTVTPAATTDAIAAQMRATLHTTLGTPAAIVPTGQDWPNQRAWFAMKRLHDYARSGADTAWKGGDGGRTVVLPDGRWLTYFADSFTGALSEDDTWGAGYTIIRNQALIHNSSGAVTGQHYSGAPGTVAWLPNQTEFPGSFYWPVGGSIVAGDLRLVMLLREGAGFGTPIDTVILTLNPSTLAEISVTSTGDPDLVLQNLVVDTDTGYCYGTAANPIRIYRVPIADVLNFGAWTYWDGTGWNTDRLAAAELLQNMPGGGTRPLKINMTNDGWDLRRYGTGWLAVVCPWHEGFLGIYYSTQPQGPWTHYMNVPTAEAGGFRWGGRVYSYTPFWHPELDPEPDQHVISYNALTLAGDPVGYVPPATTDQDFLYYDPHYVVCHIHRELF